MYLGKNRITEIKGLENLPKLESVTLGPNKLTRIGEGLNVLKDTLKELYMQENQIESIEELEALVVVLLCRPNSSVWMCHTTK